MPEIVPNSAEALVGPVRKFMAKPTQEGLFAYLEEEGVDLILQVVAEAPAGLAGDCSGCGHRARFERGKVDEKRACPLCRGVLGPLAIVGDTEKFNVFSWRIAWAREGYEGLGYGATIEEGVFTDGEILEGVSALHGLLRLHLPLFESLNVTNMKDYRSVVAMRREPAKVETRIRRKRNA